MKGATVLGLLEGPYRDLKDAPDGVANVLIGRLSFATGVEVVVLVLGEWRAESGAEWRVGTEFVGNRNSIESDSGLFAS